MCFLPADWLTPMRYRLRTLLIVVAIGPPLIAGCYFALREMSAPTWAVAIGVAQIVFWLIALYFVVRRARPTTANSPLKKGTGSELYTPNGCK